MADSKKADESSTPLLDAYLAQKATGKLGSKYTDKANSIIAYDDHILSQSGGRFFATFNICDKDGNVKDKTGHQARWVKAFCHMLINEFGGSFDQAVAKLASAYMKVEAPPVGSGRGSIKRTRDSM